VSPRSPVTIQIPQDWSEFIGFLRRHETRFLVIGAHALAAYGRPRYTGDFDIFVDPSPENVERVARALRDFVGAGADVTHALLQGKIVQIGEPPMRLDLIPRIDGVSFEEAWLGCMPVRLNEHAVNMIGRAEYIKNKKAAARDKDLLDLALLAEVGEMAVGTGRNLQSYDAAKTLLVKRRRGEKRRPRQPRRDEKRGPQKPRRPPKPPSKD
jgi:hypothetical protein